MANAGLLSLHQLLATLYGTVVGTTIAVQFLAFRISILSFPLIATGVLFRFFSRQRRLVNIGDVFLGVGLLFLGLQTMEAAFAAARDQAFVQLFLTSRFSAPFSLYLFGIVLAFLTQSGSASVAVVMALAATGTLSPDRGALMIAAEVTGTSLLALLASLGGSVAARTAALLNLGLCTLLSLTVAAFRDPLLRFLSIFSLETAGPLDAVPRLLASYHSLLALLLLAVSLASLAPLLRLAGRITVARAPNGDEEPRPRYLDTRVLNTPSLAFMQARRELERMGELAVRISRDTLALFDGFDARRAAAIGRHEEVLDILQREITFFLVSLSHTPLSQEQSARIPYMLSLVSRLEHVGDQCERLLQLLTKKKGSGLLFSEQAMDELKSFSAQVHSLLSSSFPDTPGRGEESEAFADQALCQAREHYARANSGHIKRLRSGRCSVRAGLVYSEMLTSLMTIAELAREILRLEREYQDVTREGID
jgi:phosphate:Na+ symporter